MKRWVLEYESFFLAELRKVINEKAWLKNEGSGGRGDESPFSSSTLLV